MERSRRESNRDPEPLGAAQVLNQVGGSAPSTTPEDLEGIDLATMWSHLWTMRIADELFGRLSLPRFASSAGEEAIAASAALVLGADDWIYPGSRDRALPLLRGVPIEELVAQLRQLPKAETQGRLEAGTTSQIAAVAAPTQMLGMHLSLATGHAHALKLTQSEALVLAVCGEGLCAHGRFHEAVNLALSAQLPVLFVVKRPRWTGAAPAEAGAFGEGVAARTQAAGLESVRVDGSDCVQVYRAFKRCVQRLRKGLGPSLVEVSYTPLATTTDPTLDPVHNLRSLMQDLGRYDQVHSDNLSAALRARFKGALEDVSTDDR